MGKVRKGKGNKNQTITIKIVCGAGVLWKLSDNSTFETTFYRVTSEKIGENIRAVVLADLHNNVFGQDNERLC